MNEKASILSLFPNASQDCLAANGYVHTPKPEREPASALERSAKGEKEGMGRVTVCFRFFRTRLCDADNAAASCKGLLDGLRHAHLIRNDDPSQIRLEIEQVKVKTRAEQRTEIEIKYP